VFLSEKNYKYLLDAYHHKVITVGVLDKWYKLAFNNQKPDWFYKELCVNKHKSVWAGVRAQLMSRPAKTPFVLGVVIYNKDVWGKPKFHTHTADNSTSKSNDKNTSNRRRRVGDNVTRKKINSFERARELVSRMDKQTHNKYITNLVNRLAGGQTVKKEDANIINEMFCSSSRELDQRVKVRVSTALLMWQKSHIKYGDIGLSKNNLLRLLLSHGFGGQATAGVIVASTLSPDHTRIYNSVVHKGYTEHGLQYVIEILKEVHNVVRRSMCSWVPCLDLNDGDVDPMNLMYVQSVLGRFSFNQLSSTDEIQSRTVFGRPQTVWDGREWSEVAFDRLMADQMAYTAKVFADGFKHKSHWSAQDFHARLSAFGTSGSTSKAPAYVVKDVRTGKDAVFGKTKNTWVDSLSTEYISNLLLNVVPRIRGTGVDKYEAYKQRLLLPGPPLHWLIESIVLFGGESNVYRTSPDIMLEQGNLEELVEMTRRLCLTGENGEFAIASDYKDHNLIHSHRNLKSAWIAIARALDPRVEKWDISWQDGHYREFAAAASIWAAAAISDIAAAGKLNPGKYYELVRGLWTGWRSTTFHNTLFNRYYRESTCESFRRMYGYMPLVWSQILGDDMTGQLAGGEWTGLRFLEIIDKSGLDAQDVKQMMASNKTEFLRLTYSDGNSIRGSANRAVASLISTDAQVNPPKHGPETARSINEQIHLLCRRSGGNWCEAWRDTLTSFWASVTVPGIKGNNITVSPPLNLLHAPQAAGGLGCHHLGAPPTCLIDAVPCMAEPIDIRWATNVVKGNASRAAVAVATNRARIAGLQILKPGLVRALHTEALATGALPPSVRDGIHRVQSRRFADWYTANEGVEVAATALDDHEVVRYVRAFVDQYRPTAGMPIKQVDLPGSSIINAVAIAAETISSVPQPLRFIGGLQDPRQKLVRMGGIRAASLYAKDAFMLGDDRALRILRGKYTLPLYSTGLVPTTHRVVVTECLLACAAKYRHVWTGLSDQNLADHVALVCYTAETHMSKHDIWRQQLCY